MKNLSRYTAIAVTMLFAGKAIAQPLQADGGLSQTICEGQTANLGGSPSAQFGTPPYTYSWNPAGAVSNPTDPNPTTTPAATTTFTLSVTDAVSAVATATLTISVNPAPDITPVTDITDCNGSTISGTSFSSTIAGTTFNWTNSNSTIGLSSGGTVSQPSFTATNPGSGPETGTISVTATSPAGCTSISPMVYNITVNPTPDATFTYPASNYCQSDANAFPVFGAGSAGVFSSAPAGLALMSAATGEINIAASSPGTYTITNTIPAAGGCSTAISSFTLSINPNPTAYAGTDRFICLGTPINFAASSSGAVSYLWTYDDGGTSTLPNPSHGYASAGTYHVSLTAYSSAGCSAIDTAMVYVYDVPVITTIGNEGAVCGGACTGVAYAVVTGGSAPYSYTWTGVSANNDTITSLCSGSYTLDVMDGHMCAANTSTTIALNPNTDIYGHVSYSGGLLAPGTNTAVLLQYLSTYTAFDTVQTVSVNAAGDYLFTNIPSGDYLVEIFADPVVYPTLVPTYYGNHYLWDSSAVVNHDCYFNDTAHITMIENAAGAGTGMLMGSVSQGDGFGRVPGDPVPGIDVKLGRNPGGQMVAQTETDGSGNYSFSNLPLSSGDYYTIYVDIPGLERDSTYNITLTAGADTYMNLNYVADSNSVWPVYATSVSVKNPSLAAGVQFSVYPNPTGTNTTIAYVLNTDAKVQLDVYDVLGKKAESLVNGNQQGGDYKVNLAKLKAGVYFITLNINNNSNTTRLVVID